MKNPALLSALSVSTESQDAEQLQESQDLLDVLVEEANDLTPEAYVEDRIEVERDINLLETAADVIEARGEAVSQEDLEHGKVLANAVVGRYGIEYTGSSFEDPTLATQQQELLAHMGAARASLESALDVTLESYGFSDMWNHIGILNREIPNLADRIAVLKNYDGKASIRPIGLSKIFMKDGEPVQNLAKGMSDTVDLVTKLLDLGQKMTDQSRKATAAAIKVDWKDAHAAEQGLQAVAAGHNYANEVFQGFNDVWTLANRKMTVKRFNVKGADGLRGWGQSASLRLSGIKSTGSEWAAFLIGGGYGLAALEISRGSNKRKIDLKEFVVALERFKESATRSQAIRHDAPKRWREHQNLVKSLKADVNGSDQANLARRLISEQDRLGWECINAAFSIQWVIIRQINDCIDITVKAAKNA